MYIYISKRMLWVFATAVLILGASGYSLIFAATTWIPPSTTAPKGNVEAPINVGMTDQIKDGGLSVSTLLSDGEIVSTRNGADAHLRMINGTKPSSFLRNDGTNTWFLLTNDGDPLGMWNDLKPFYFNNTTGMVNMNTGLTLANGAPQITFDDTSGDNNIWWLHSNAYSGSKGRMHFLYDRNNNGSWDSGDGNPTMYMESGAATDGTQDKLTINGQMNAGQYCDASGQNCFDGADIQNLIKNYNTLVQNIDSGGKSLTQHGTVTNWTCEKNSSDERHCKGSVTYPVAFASAPVVSIGGSGCIPSVSASGFSISGASYPDSRPSTGCYSSVTVGTAWTAVGTAK